MRWALGIEYEGTSYHGWQSQEFSKLITVQDHVEHALSRVADHKVNAICAGRTDKGVHALEQVIHFDTSSLRSSHAWISGVNCYLPKDIRVLWACEVDESFHARYSAIARCYDYFIFNHAVRPAILRNLVTTYPHTLDEIKMAEAGSFLLGEHDFSAFRGAHCQSKTTSRHLVRLEVKRNGYYVSIQVEANAFLHHMVRNIVGVLLEIGIGKRPPVWAKEVLMGKERRLAGITAPPNGLYLSHVSYKESFYEKKSVDLRTIT